MRDRERRRDRPGRPDRRARRPPPAPDRHLRPEDLGQRAPDHALPRDAGHGGRGEARKARDRNDQARHRPLLRGQGGAPRASASRTCSTPRSCARRSWLRSSRSASSCARSRRTRGSTFTRSPRSTRPTATASSPTSPTRRRSAGTRSTPTGSSSSRARRRPSSTSTTAPIRSSPRRTRSPARRASAREWGRPTSTRSGASPRRTRPASAPGRFRPSSSTTSARAFATAGHEFGTTTGRERRCGYLDLVALRYAARLNGLSSLVITKLDVLAGMDPIRVAVRYRSDEGAVLNEFPYHQTVLHGASPEYEELPGFTEDIGECRTDDDLPQAARDYIRFIEDFVGVPVSFVGVGPGREQMVARSAARPPDLDSRFVQAARIGDVRLSCSERDACGLCRGRRRARTGFKVGPGATEGGAVACKDGKVPDRRRVRARSDRVGPLGLSASGSTRAFRQRASVEGRGLQLRRHDAMRGSAIAVCSKDNDCSSARRSRGADGRRREVQATAKCPDGLEGARGRRERARVRTSAARAHSRPEIGRSWGARFANVYGEKVEAFVVCDPSSAAASRSSKTSR